MTPIADYIAMHGGIDQVHAFLAGNTARRWNNLLQLCPTPAALSAWLSDNHIAYVEQVQDSVAGMDAICPPVPFSLVYPQTILFNSNVGIAERPVDIDGLFATLASIHPRISLHATLQKSHSDQVYGLLPKADIDWLAANRPARTRSWSGTDPLRDCDNAVCLDRGWLAQQGPMNAAIGEVQALVTAGGRTFAHVFIVLVDTAHALWVIDSSSSDAVAKELSAAYLFGHLAPIIDIYNIRF